MQATRDELHRVLTGRYESGLATLTDSELADQ
jgi:hypothetical protein